MLRNLWRQRAVLYRGFSPSQTRSFYSLFTAENKLTAQNLIDQLERAESPWDRPLLIHCHSK
jgi:hypothetical protein